MPKVKRNESTMQFIETARQLELYILQHAKAFEKKHGDEMEYVYECRLWASLVKYSISLLNNVTTANKIFIVKHEDVSRRGELFDNALLCVNSISTQLKVLKEIHQQIKSGTVNRIDELAEQEKRLIVAVKKSDKRFLK